MHGQIKKRLTQDIIFYPLISQDGTGDKTFNELGITIKGYAVPKVTTVTTRSGQQVTTSTVIYIDGDDLSKISLDDECKPPYGDRRPIQSIQPYNSLTTGYEIIEVLL